MIHISNDALKKPENSSLLRSMSYFERIFDGKLDGIDAWLAGGCFRAFFARDEKIQDIDIFTTERKECAKLVWALRSLGFKPFFKNENAIKGYIMHRGKKVFVDVVKKFYPTATECIRDFDFSVAKFAYHMKSKGIYHSDGFFPDLMQKRLVIPDDNFGNPLGSLKRLQKYNKLGYTACNGTLLTMSTAIAKIDFDNPEQNSFAFYPDGSVRIILFD